MVGLDNRDPNGNALSELWERIEKEDPEVASLVKEGVDKGKLESLDYYIRYNRALLKMGQMMPDLTIKNHPKNKIYQLFVAYTEYQLRNT